MKTAHTKLIFSFAWNGLEAFISQIILLCHHGMLFYASPASFFGLVSTLFSAVYCVINLAHFGYDALLPAFFSQACRSKYAFRKIIIHQFLPECILLITGGIIIFFGYSSLCFLHHPSLSPHIMLIMVGIALCESIKKSLRTILHLLFRNQVTTLTELFFIISYCSTVWFLFLAGFAWSLPLIFGTFLLLSILVTSLLAYQVYSFYHSLPDHDEFSIPFLTLCKHRFTSYSITLNHVLFSSNFLIPLLAQSISLPAAGILKLITMVTHTITLMIKKIFNTSIQALFATSDQTGHYTLFSTLTSLLYSTLIGIMIFFSSCLACSWLAHKMATTLILYALLFFILELSEYFFIPYEQFLICRQRTDIFLIGLSIIGSEIIYMINNRFYEYPLLFIAILITSRLIFYYWMHHSVHKQWSLSYSLSIQPTALMVPIVAAFLLFLCVR